MKFAFLMGKAPASFAAMASKVYPIVVSTPLVRPFGLSAQNFILLLAVFEMVAAIGFFFNNKYPALMVAAVMMGAEYIGFTQGSNPAMPANPMCGDKAVCIGSHVFHAALVVMAYLAWTAGRPLCAAWVKACPGWCKKSSSSGAESRTPSRPRRAAAMKNKKDE